MPLPHQYTRMTGDLYLPDFPPAAGRPSTGGASARTANICPHINVCFVNPQAPPTCTNTEAHLTQRLLPLST